MYKKSTLTIQIKIDDNTNQNKAAVTVSVLEKADFRITKIIRDKERHKSYDKGVSSLRRHKNYLCACI